jgi:carboxypeptidase C (cathepsin A)
MSDKDQESQAGTQVATVPEQKDQEHRPPEGASTEDTWAGGDGETIPYRATGEWMLLREKDKPVAEMFSVSYVRNAEESDDPAGRPVTFVFNGGPGASSAYLHVGALGPQRVQVNDDGTMPPPPARLVPNEESWLAFTDLVFIDPIGTGFSRLVDSSKDGKGEKAEAKPGDDKADKRFFALKRDLESIGEFIRRWLSANHRWGSPVLIAGESYGGYRVAKLARMLPEDYGIGLSGAVVISPALEFILLDPSDYDVLPWVDRVPTMALAAAAHGRNRAVAQGASTDEVRSTAEQFATGDYARFLTMGASMPAEEREAILQRLADLIGLSVEEVTRAEGRIPFVRYVRSLLADEGKVVGIYDATVSTANPFPDRDGFEWPDPTLSGIERVFAGGVNQQLRTRIGVTTDREYILLSEEVNTSWQQDQKQSWAQAQVAATDDLRYAMSLSPHLRVFLTHGIYDLITPYFSSDRLANLMRLRPEAGDRMTVRHFEGGHMFYTWRDSRQAFRAEMGQFYSTAVGLS